ncbi:hypothetical protein M3196_13865 [Fictibacillus nanhaiensis]|uniref:hypothetical protein n=1 Tax=Fictibacillus nanhaiensis TaxID=742169 RepID=UPI0020401938|nr:hypothetical protein [Fictibacillus nanhaiensis]MCM3732736.1 hypothetical protein [Fictibacillus nanhaiensis]
MTMELATLTTATAPTLGDIQRRFSRSGVIDVDGLKRDTEAYLDKTINVDRGTLDLLAGVWAFVGETIEREEWRSYTREQWAELEYAHVELSGYTEPDLQDDLLTKVEYGAMTIEEARGIYASYRECAYLFCLEMYRPRRRDQRYCCPECRWKQAEAERRFKRTGTYLPVHVYRDNRDATDEQNYKENVTTYKPTVMERTIEPAVRLREHGRKRNRVREEKIGFTPIKHDKE